MIFVVENLPEVAGFELEMGLKTNNSLHLDPDANRGLMLSKI